jgi:hypothetical protein
VKGTGKTSTARKMGQVYYDMGLLATNEVIETSATELVGQYVGQTGPKTQRMLERGLGKVLFIDEAYRLAEGHFATEAVDELVDCITKPRFAQKLIIILAGYDADINRLMSTNPGLTSRFPESLQFECLSPRDCVKLLHGLLERNKQDIVRNSTVSFDISCLYRSDSDLTQKLVDGFDILSRASSWANARDIETLVKAIFGKTIRELDSISGSKLVLSRETVIEELQAMINERQNRENDLPKHSPVGPNPRENLLLRTRSLDAPVISMENRSQKFDVRAGNEVEAKLQDRDNQESPTAGRDKFVTDVEWNQLQKGKAAVESGEKDYLEMTERGRKQRKELLRLKDEENKAALAVEEAKRQQDQESMIHLEGERLKLEIERREQEAIYRKLEIKKKALVEARRKEQAIQGKLRGMGVCVQGYQWIKQTGGYRCAGGSHWVSDAQLK